MGGWLDVFDPATAAPFAQVAGGDAADVDAAVMAARRAFPGLVRTAQFRTRALAGKARRRARSAARGFRPRRIARRRQADQARARGRDPARDQQPALLRACGDAVRQRIAPRPGRAELHAAPTARRGRPRSRRGTCRSTCSPGRSRPRWRRAIPSSPSPRKSRRRPRRCSANSPREIGFPARRAQHRPRPRSRKWANRWWRIRQVKAISFTGSTAVGRRIAGTGRADC